MATKWIAQTFFPISINTNITHQGDPMPEFKPTSYATEQRVRLSRSEIQDLHEAAQKFPEVEYLDIVVTEEGIKARFTLDWTRDPVLSPDRDKPTQEEVLAQLANLRTKPPTKQTETKEDTQNATHNQLIDRPAAEAVK
jgi:hypothetical protein